MSARLRQAIAWLRHWLEGQRRLDERTVRFQFNGEHPASPEGDS